MNIKVACVLVVLLLLQGCILGVAAGVIAAEVEYDNYRSHAQVHTPNNIMTFNQYFEWSNPQCIDRQHCDRTKYLDKKYTCNLNGRIVYLSE